MNLLENRPLRLVIGIVLLALGLLALVTGNVVDTTPAASRRIRYREATRWTSRAENPAVFYMEVAVLLAGGGFLVYLSRQPE